MGRTQEPFPSITRMTLLMMLYAEMNNIESVKEIGEQRHRENLSEVLFRDRAISKSSRNLVNKLRGYPSYDSEKECDEGTKIESLDVIAHKVIEHYGFQKPDGSARPDLTNPWIFFSKSLFQVPDRLRDLERKKYYKYLSESEKRDVDLFVCRTMAELVSNRPQMKTWLMLHQGEANGLQPFIFQIDSKERTCFVTAFFQIDEKWFISKRWYAKTPSNVFEYSQYCLSLTLANENPQSQESCQLMLLTNGHQETPSHIKGMLVSAENRKPGKLVSAAVFLGIKNSYSDAFEIIQKNELGADENTLNFLKEKIVVIEP
jgi:hypothetical protein